MASTVTRFSLRSSLRTVTSSANWSCSQNQSVRTLSSLQYRTSSHFLDIVPRNTFQFNSQQWRFYSAAKVTKADVESRVLVVCKAFDKITADKITLDSHFINDLGLDSLDHVEVIMAVEDEFGFEIPDEHAEKLLTPAKIAEYVCEHEKVFE